MKGDYNSISQIAMNLTHDEFKGYCKGKEVEYLLRASRRNAPQELTRKARYWGKIFDQMKQHCKPSK